MKGCNCVACRAVRLLKRFTVVRKLYGEDELRDQLKEILLQRKRFKGTFERYGLKRAYKGFPPITILLKDVMTIKEEHLTDHLWFNYTKRFEALGTLYPGDVIAFNARVRTYVKGYVGRGEDNRSIDYKMTHPSKVSLIFQAEREEAYYTTCIKCGYHNFTKQRDNDPYGRCYRCGYDMKGEIPVTEIPESTPESIPEFPKLEQTKLGGVGPL